MHPILSLKLGDKLTVLLLTISDICNFGVNALLNGQLPKTICFFSAKQLKDVVLPEVLTSENTDLAEVHLPIFFVRTPSIESKQIHCD